MKQAVVLGMSGSVGQEITKILLNKGYQVLGTCHNSDPNAFKHKGVEIVLLDFADFSQVRKFCDKLKELEGIDFITSTIGAYTMNKFERISFEQFERDVHINFLHFAYVLQHTVPKLNKDAQVVFLLTEMVVGEPNYFLSSYVSSKYALLGLMKSMAGELKQRGIRVNAISPGMMDTAFSKNVPSLIKEQYIAQSPLKRLVEPKEVGSALMKIMNGSMNGKNILILGKPHDPRH